MTTKQAVAIEIRAAELAGNLRGQAFWMTHDEQQGWYAHRSGIDRARYSRQALSGWLARQIWVENGEPV